MFSFSKFALRSVGLATLALSIDACTAPTSSADDEELSASEAELHRHPGRSVLGVKLSGLERLGDGYVYEGWLIVDGKPVSAGRFNLDGRHRPLYFSGPMATLSAATAYVLTIEPAENDDPMPSKVHVLAGDIRRHEGRRRAMLSTSHPAAFGTDFASAMGRFILQTPSTSEPSDYAQGVWFVDPATGSPSLSLPALPEGWTYEGWVVVDGKPLSTGRFRSVSGADSDGAGPTAGPNAGPPFPGQDFINPPRNLVGGAVVVSVEPEDDDSPAPFAIKPLIAEKVEDVGPGVLADMKNTAEANTPRGAVVLY